MSAELVCFKPSCRARFPINAIIYNCKECGGLLEATYSGPAPDLASIKRIWRERRMSNAPLDQSGVWRYREMFEFLADPSASVVTLREGNTPLLPSKKAAAYGGLDGITFKHQGFNPTGSFKDNGMTCGAAQARALGMTRVACVSTGNTSASMAAYASAGGLQPVIFIPHGNISYGKLAQALEYGARTIQIDANFDQILALVLLLADRLGIYLLNSINPFRIEGQKSIVIEMMDQRDWAPPDWIVLPGGNLGNTSAFGKALRELCAWGLIHKTPQNRCHSGRRCSALLRFRSTRGRIHIGPASRNPGHGHQDRRPSVLAKSPPRNSILGRGRREGHGTGNRRCQGPDRSRRDWLRARLGRDPRWYTKAHGRQHHARRCRRHRSSHWQRVEGPRLHLPLPHGPARGARRHPHRTDIR